jgi:hypothetical protein
MRSLFAFVVLAALGQAAELPIDSGSTPGSRASEVELPRFEGYSTIGDASFFALTIKRAEKVAGQGWLSIGESIGGFRLEKFNRDQEVLTVRTTGGAQHELRLPSATASNAATPNRSAVAKAAALKEIESYRQRGKDIFGPANVTVDTDGTLLPESRRANYSVYRTTNDAKGVAFMP